MDVFIRGGTILWSGSFLDNAGVVSNPDTAKVDIDYPTPTGRQSTTITLTQNPTNTWTGMWDSSGSTIKPGTVYWHVRATTSGTIKTVQDGDFELEANRANLDNLTA